MRIPLPDSYLAVERRDVENVLDTASTSFGTFVQHLLRRDGSDAPSTACQETGSSSACQTNATTNEEQTLPIVLGVVIPVAIASFLLIFLHRRHVKKLRAEDVNDPHKSLDFGLDGIPKMGRKGKNGLPEMTVTDVSGSGSSRRMGQRSLDMGVGSPYLMPSGLQSSRESIHSMSRSIHDEHDPYRPVTLLRPSMDGDSLRSPRPFDDKASTYSESIGYPSHAEKAGLVVNARPMSQSFPILGESSSPDSVLAHDFPAPPLPSVNHDFLPDDPITIDHNKELSEIHTSESEPAEFELPPRRSSLVVPPRGDSIGVEEAAGARQSSNYGDEDAASPMPGFTINEPENHYDIDPSLISTGRASLDNPSLPQGLGLGLGLQSPPIADNQRLSVVGVRPLPPDVPDDNPEQRANRIRSFYREYFDDSKPNPAGQYDEDADTFDAAIYDPDTGGFFIPGSRPFAQGPGRRAMTPPPRGKPRVSGNSNTHGRKLSMMSTGRLGARGRAPVPKKKLPPPKALTSLPTPHLLKEDSAVFNAIDFAPPASFRNLQNGGRADSPLGVQRPFSPSVRAFTPLVSSFDNLTVMPSPHELRKSSTFTALDFAPPSKLRDPAIGSPETGSIRSNRSGISAVQSDALRQGAYRVSRIPKEMVTTKEDIMSQLRPKMNLTNPA